MLVCARSTRVSSDSFMNRSMVSVLSCPSKRRFSHSQLSNLSIFGGGEGDGHDFLLCGCLVWDGSGSETAARRAAAIPAMSRAIGKTGAGARAIPGVGVEIRWTKLATTADAPPFVMGTTAGDLF